MFRTRLYPRPRWVGGGAGSLDVPGHAAGRGGGGQVVDVDMGVVSFAEQGGVGDVGVSTAGPVGQVVGVGPLGGMVHPG